MVVQQMGLGSSLQRGPSALKLLTSALALLFIFPYLSFFSPLVVGWNMNLSIAQKGLTREYLQTEVFNTEWASLNAASLPEAKPRDPQADRKPLLSVKKDFFFHPIFWLLC